MSITFPVSDVEINTGTTSDDPYLGFHPTPQDSFVKKKCKDVTPDAYAFNLPGDLIWEPLANPFLGAVHIAYDGHIPLTLSPDDLWCVLCGGLSAHINENSESLRHKFVTHEGKKPLTVVVPFSKGSPGIPWGWVLSEFQKLIDQSTTPGTGDITAHNFTTTGPVEKVVGHVQLMGAMQKYFTYGMMTACGIPTITLLGETSDWESIRTRVEGFRVCGLDWWVDALTPILDQFVRASKGDVDLDFWETIYKQRSMSGGGSISGSFINLFPYLSKGTQFFKSPYVGVPKSQLSTSNVPRGHTVVPFDWVCGSSHPMNFYAGHLGITIDNKSVRPVMGWAVVDRQDK